MDRKDMDGAFVVLDLGFLNSPEVHCWCDTEEEARSAAARAQRELPGEPTRKIYAVYRIELID